MGKYKDTNDKRRNPQHFSGAVSNPMPEPTNTKYYFLELERRDTGKVDTTIVIAGNPIEAEKIGLKSHTKHKLVGIELIEAV